MNKLQNRNGTDQETSHCLTHLLISGVILSSVLMMTGCGNGTNTTEALQPPTAYLVKCPEQLPDAKSGDAADLLENHTDVVIIYYDCAPVHNKLVDWHKKMQKRFKEKKDD